MGDGFILGRGLMAYVSEGLRLPRFFAAAQNDNRAGFLTSSQDDSSEVERVTDPFLTFPCERKGHYRAPSGSCPARGDDFRGGTSLTPSFGAAYTFQNGNIQKAENRSSRPPAGLREPGKV